MKRYTIVKIIVSFFHSLGILWVWYITCPTQHQPVFVFLAILNMGVSIVLTCSLRDHYLPITVPFFSGIAAAMVEYCLIKDFWTSCIQVGILIPVLMAFCAVTSDEINAEKAAAIAERTAAAAEMAAAEKIAAAAAEKAAQAAEKAAQAAEKTATATQNASKAANKAAAEQAATAKKTMMLHRIGTVAGIAATAAITAAVILWFEKKENKE